MIGHPCHGRLTVMNCHQSCDQCYTTCRLVVRYVGYGFSVDSKTFSRRRHLLPMPSQQHNSPQNDSPQTDRP